jgi:site-specific DNA recombinase
MAKIEAVAYLRVSTVGQVDGHGLERQDKAIKAYARKNRVEILEVYREEGVSGTIKDRPALTRLMVEIIQAGRPKLILVESADRLGRDLLVSLLILEECRKHGIRVVACDSGMDLTDNKDPMVEAMATVQQAFAQLDKRRLGMKLAQSRRDKRALGFRVDGRKPYGHRDEEKGGLALIQSLAKTGATFQAIADQLNEKGIPTRQGKPWLRGSVASVLKTNGMKKK